MKLVEKKVRVEKSDMVPADSDLRYMVVELGVEDVAHAFNEVSQLMTDVRQGKIEAKYPTAVEIWDSLKASDIADSLNAILTERASNARRVVLKIVKGTSSPTAPRQRSEIEL
jgi:hypothetical protein